MSFILNVSGLKYIPGGHCSPVDLSTACILRPRVRIGSSIFHELFFAFVLKYNQSEPFKNSMLIYMCTIKKTLNDSIHLACDLFS